MTMQIKIQLVVFLAGILSKTSGDPYRFLLIEEPKTWSEAQSYCREMYKDLATVQSDEDRGKLRQAASAENFTSDAWTGFYYEDNSWRWSYQRTPVSFIKWNSWEPDLSYSTEACATVNKYGRWSDTSCTEQKYFFCQTEKLDKLQDMFKYTEKFMNWFDAQVYCKTHEIDLATITQITENSFLAKTIYDKNDWEAWIGLSRNLSQWYWSDQTEVSWSSLAWVKPVSSSADKACARANTDGLMSDHNCSSPLPFYCRENTKIQSLRLTVESDGPLNESAAREAIEMKMKQIFLENNIYSITWSVHPDGKIFQQQPTEENITQETPAACESMGPL